MSDCTTTERVVLVSKEICYCSGSGTTIECERCHIKVHKECIGEDNETKWMCDMCKAKDALLYKPVCCICNQSSPYYLFIHVCEQTWIHAKCLRCMYLSMKSQPEDDTICIPTTPKVVGGKWMVDRVIISNMLRKEWKEDISSMNHLLTQFVAIIKQQNPPETALTIETDKKCNYCSSRYGYLTPCGNHLCNAFFHYLCYEIHNPTVLMYDRIRSKSLSCVSHSKEMRSMKRPRENKGKQADSVMVSASPIVAPQTLPSYATNGLNEPRKKPAKSKEMVRASEHPIENKEGDIMKQNMSIESSGKEDDTVCDICHEGFSEQDDMMIFCEKCNLPVHQSCYGISKIPEGEWVCCRCACGLNPSSVVCAVCRQHGGAMHRSKEGVWVHMICILYTPELSLDFQESEAFVRGLEMISKARKVLKCYFCNETGGGCIQCSHRSCSVPYHPYCALQYNCLFSFTEKNDTILYISYCALHTEMKLNKKEKKGKRGRRRRKDKVKDTPLQYADQILKKILPSEKEKVVQLCSSDFWKYIELYFITNPAISSIADMLHYITIASYENSALVQPSLVNYCKTILHARPFGLNLQQRVSILKDKLLYSIPPLGKHYLQLWEEENSTELTTQAYIPGRSISTTLHHVQRFQGFDINDFADLRENYDLYFNMSYLHWVQNHDICKYTRFREARKSDIPWLLQVNTINPTFSKADDYRSAFSEKNEFIILAERQNMKGEWIPTGMVHYYLMWYYPCTGKSREAVRAVYVCTLQRVSRTTHGSYVTKHQCEAENQTGTVLLSLAFLHGKHLHMAMGCCDSTDNSISFYKTQFDMKELPKGDGRHYTPMQIILADFKPMNTIMKQMISPYHGTLLCEVSLPKDQPATNVYATNQPAFSVHFEHNRVYVSNTIRSSSFDVNHSYMENNSDVFIPLASPVPTESLMPNHSYANEMKQDCFYLENGTFVCYTNEIPHFVKEEKSKEEEGDTNGLRIASSLYTYKKEDAICIRDSNGVYDELEKCQERLYAVSCMNEERLCLLLQHMLTKEKEPASQLISYCDDLKKQLEDYVRANRPDHIRDAEEEDENVDAICDVCGDGNSDFGNVILFCDGCNAAVHQCCYDIMNLPKGDWFCNVCEDILVNQLGITDVLHVTSQEATDSIVDSIHINEGEKDDVVMSMLDNVKACPVLDKLHELRDRVYCCICGYSCGAMMPTLVKGKYAHVSCGLWHPDAIVSNEWKECAIEYAEKDKTMSIEENPLSTEVKEKQESKSMECEETKGMTDMTDMMRNEQIDVSPTYVSPYISLRNHPEMNRYLINTSSYNAQKKTPICQLCRKRYGVIGCCFSGGCNHYVHASCAIQYQLETFWINKPGHSSSSKDDVLVDKDFYLHCFNHSGGFQGREMPRKQVKHYCSPCPKESNNRNEKDDEEVIIKEEVKRLKNRRKNNSLRGLQKEEINRLREKRERKRRMNKPRRLTPPKNGMQIKRKPRSKAAQHIVIILEWLKASESGKLLMKNEENVVMKIKKDIENQLLPRFSNWMDYGEENATLPSFYHRYENHIYRHTSDLIIGIREIYLSLLSYTYPSGNPYFQHIASVIANDALTLSRIMYRVEGVYNSKRETFCICMAVAENATDFMVGCDGCGEWYHPFCLGFNDTKYEGFLTTYYGYYIDVRENTGCFYCPKCCNEEHFAKLKLYSETELAMMGIPRLSNDKTDFLNQGKREGSTMEMNEDKRQRIAA